MKTKIIDNEGNKKEIEFIEDPSKVKNLEKSKWKEIKHDEAEEWLKFVVSSCIEDLNKKVYKVKHSTEHTYYFRLEKIDYKAVIYIHSILDLSEENNYIGSSLETETKVYKKV